MRTRALEHAHARAVSALAALSPAVPPPLACEPPARRGTHLLGLAPFAPRVAGSATSTRVCRVCVHARAPCAMSVPNRPARTRTPHPTGVPRVPYPGRGRTLAPGSLAPPVVRVPCGASSCDCARAGCEGHPSRCHTRDSRPLPHGSHVGCCWYRVCCQADTAAAPRRAVPSAAVPVEPGVPGGCRSRRRPWESLTSDEVSPVSRPRCGDMRT
jgi:hypothetical protein